jgi:hypothetical protein
MHRIDESGRLERLEDLLFRLIEVPQVPESSMPEPAPRI